MINNNIINKNEISVRILNEAYKEFNGINAFIINLKISKMLANLIKGMFGPYGFGKLIEDSSNNFRFTHKGHNTLKFLKKKLPFAKIYYKYLETQEQICGDGTKSIILFSHLLLEKAFSLIEQGFSPALIYKGFSIAAKLALKVLEENIIIIKNNDWERIKALIYNVFSNRFEINIKDFFSRLIINELKTKRLMNNEVDKFSFDNILFKRITGKNVLDSDIINGLIIFREKPFSFLPNIIKNPKIILVNNRLDFFIKENKKFMFEANIDTPSKLKEFHDFNVKYYNKIAITLKEKGINVIFCKKSINKELIKSCTKKGIIALELIQKDDFEILSKILQVKFVSSLNDISNQNIGTADFIEFKTFSDKKLLLIGRDSCDFLTFLIFGCNNYILDDLEESLKAALKVLINTIKDKKILPGGGALECEITKTLREKAKKEHGKVQVVILEYGKALESLISYVFMNAGEDPLELIPNLRFKHYLNRKYSGFDCYMKKIVNVIEEGIFDGYRVKRLMFRLVDELIRQILRIDNLIILANKELNDKLKNEKETIKIMKRNEEMRNFFKKNEEKMFST